MKYSINEITSGEDELILNYKEVTPEVNDVLMFMNKKQRKLSGKTEEGVIIFSPDEILYIEKVDDKTFAYTKDHVIQLQMSLAALEAFLEDIKYFRCSKSMIVNIDMVEHLKSLPSNRIDATLLGGEHILISRTYASEFRRILKGGN